jgi:hypothetical protein
MSVQGVRDSATGSQSQLQGKRIPAKLCLLARGLPGAPAVKEPVRLSRPGRTPPLLESCEVTSPTRSCVRSSWTRGDTLTPPHTGPTDTGAGSEA